MEQIDFEKFQSVDIRIGTVVKAEIPEWSHWVMRLSVDFGSEIGIKKIFSGIMKFYKPEDLEGNQFAFVVNLKPKKIGPKNDMGNFEYSEGMMLMAEGKAVEGQSEEDTKPILFKPADDVENGARLL